MHELSMEYPAFLKEEHYLDNLMRKLVSLDHYVLNTLLAVNLSINLT
jgi:hypothetical protein